MTAENNVVEYIAGAVSRIVEKATAKYPERTWMFEVARLYWQSIVEAREKGIPLILHPTPFPSEIIYAFGAVPVCLDSLAPRLASLDEQRLAAYVDIAQKYVPEHLCAINKAGAGAILAGDLPKPAALISLSVPCDSARIAYPAIADRLDVPHFCIDAPYEQNERGYKYIGKQVAEVVSFLEEVTGRKLDWNRMAQVVEYSNRGYELIGKLADLRKTIPCPLPGRLLVLNELFGIMAGGPEVVDFLEAEYEIGRKAVAQGKGCTTKEKHRIAWIQNPIWFNVGVYDWLEKEYGAVALMDAFGYQDDLHIDDPWDKEQVFMGLARRILRDPMVHGSAGPAEYWMNLTRRIVADYRCDMAIFAGHVGCKHTWAVGKVIKDTIYDEFGIPVLMFDVDALDSRYKGPDVIKENIKEFMEAVR